MTKTSLTQQDIVTLKKMIDVTLEAKLDVKLTEKFTEQNNKFSHLPTKQEFFDYMDKLMTEVKKSQQEELVNTHRLNNHESRITKVEQVIYPG